jgi:hypothetical protein
LIVWDKGDNVPGCKAATAVTLIILLPKPQEKFREPELEVQVTLIPMAYRILVEVPDLNVLVVPVTTPPEME